MGEEVEAPVDVVLTGTAARGLGSNGTELHDKPLKGPMEGVLGGCVGVAGSDFFLFVGRQI